MEMKGKFIVGFSAILPIRLVQVLLCFCWKGMVFSDWHCYLAMNTRSCIAFDIRWFILQLSVTLTNFVHVLWLCNATYITKKRLVHILHTHCILFIMSVIESDTVKKKHGSHKRTFLYIGSKIMI